MPSSWFLTSSLPLYHEHTNTHISSHAISHLVGPLSHSYAAAGFFPKSIEPLEFSGLADDDEADRKSSSSLDDDQDSVYNQSKYWLIEDDGLKASETGDSNSAAKN